MQLSVKKKIMNYLYRLMLIRMIELEFNETLIEILKQEHSKLISLQYL